LDSTIPLFILEVTGNDKITVQGMSGGSLVGTALTIESSDWGPDLDLDAGRAETQEANLFIQNDDRNNTTVQPIAGLSFLVSDLGVSSIDGLQLLDDEGSATFDPAVVGYVIPEPASLALVGLGVLSMLPRRRHR